MDILQKALKLTSNGGDNLSQEDLRPAIAEYLNRLNPLWALIPKGRANGITHSYIRRTAVPRGQFEGEVATQTSKNSTYDRQSAALKIVRSAGGVSSFQQAVAADFIDALNTELEGSLFGLSEILEWSAIYGNTGDAKQFPGIYQYVTGDATAQLAVASGGSILDVDATLALSHLDTMVDKVRMYRDVRGDQYIFLTSPAVISKVSALQTRVNREAPMFEHEGGFRFATYRGIPMVESSALAAAGTTTSPTVTATASAGGSMSDGTYYYAIASVTIAGEQAAGTSDSAVTATTDNSVTLTWTADANALSYNVYRGAADTADSRTLIATIPAVTYDGTGAPSTALATWIDDGTYTPVAAVHPLAVNEHQILLLNVSQAHGYNVVGIPSPLGTTVDSYFNYVPLATTKGALEYMIEGFLTGFTAYPQVNVLARRAAL